MGQQIINIPMVWDDDLFKKALEKGVIENVKDQMIEQSMKRLGIRDRYGYSELFEKIVRDCMREVINDNKDKIIEEVISRGVRSLTSSKEYKEAKKKLGGE
jgi:uncharacterized membrane-anchored protein YjiN (DUF445 family)